MLKSNISVVVLVVLLIGCASCLKGPPTPSDWAAAIQKATKFVNQLSLDEKVSLATGVGWQGGPCVGNTPAISRLNYAGLCLEDSPLGVRFADLVSAFPAGINVASTWNRTLMYERGAAMGAEFRGKGVNVQLGPMMNMGRVPAGGRNWEGFGADPYLSGESAYQTVVGIQDQGVIANAKHYILNEQEHFRTTESSNIDPRSLHEIYVWPFLKSVNAGVGSVMCSYNRINNTYACQDDYTLNTVLKKELGFQGYVMSDWSATMSGVPSVLGGLDMTMPGDITFGSHTSYFGKNLSNAVQNGQVSQARLNDMGIRIMTPYYLLGQDQGYPPVNFDFRDPSKGKHINVQGDHKNVIRKIGADSNILLKNTGNVLPFLKNITGGAASTFALIGSDAGPNPKGPNSCEDHGCDIGTLAQGWGSGTALFPYLVTPLDGITARAKVNGQTVVSSLSDSDLNAAKKAAASADIAIVFGNADSGEGYITVEGNAGDRNDLSLWHNVDALIEAVASVNTRTVVVLHVVGPVTMPWINNPNIKAVVLAGIPGQESGNALADVLFGDVNPSGKLVYTIGNSRSDYPADVIYNANQLPIVYSEKLLIDYRWFDAKNIKPTFPFGFGLSYTTFIYSSLQISTALDGGVRTGPTQGNGIKETTLYKVSVVIENSGQRDGEEVAQLYLAFPAAAGEPPQILRGFDKVFIAKGQSTLAQFEITDLDLSVFDTGKNAWVIPSGTFKVLVGASSRDIRLTGNISR